MHAIFAKPNSMTEKSSHYCPGCTHGVIHRLVSELLDEFDLREKSVGVAPVGCAVLAYHYIDVDFVEAPHGRAPAVATGVKRGRPELFVFTYQGDGDLASIGTAEIVHAANRGEKITVVFANNAIYGMTGGQMAPTTLPNQITTTSPYGRDVNLTGYPIGISEMLATLRTDSYIARVSVHDPENVINAKKVLRQAFQNQVDNRCFSMVEVLSTCPTNWGLSPIKAMQWLKENMIPYFPLGVFKTPDTSK
ncbi:MAG: 2-oxoglutarate oxidoreductase [Planctomycetes bacterium]|jgi:2-oxoglutarate ferredoxin oxidoreductase subunit beta|nr:2-oxoglutarate oxidoreductase [Planctomycetota bacterium]HON45531.1 thiamine pyrophosphate-dependent enzyme [Planctomycetota bacterium]HPY75424.1 thiamine pyrophosphate-dependent enzyme [Planctomycetota bacterium]HQB01037.1 thiamine pyrophosphate-dependent enzyme [Planctomycetota bacterium]HRU51728.1 thiamine pyrophosphate-dependent enzyme [Planctomycetota bacterium]